MVHIQAAIEALEYCEIFFLQFVFFFKKYSLLGGKRAYWLNNWIFNVSVWRVIHNKKDKMWLKDELSAIVDSILINYIVQTVARCRLRWQGDINEWLMNKMNIDELLLYRERKERLPDSVFLKTVCLIKHWWVFWNLIMKSEINKSDPNYIILVQLLFSQLWCGLNLYLI